MMVADDGWHDWFSFIKMKVYPLFIIQDKYLQTFKHLQTVKKKKKKKMFTNIVFIMRFISEYWHNISQYKLSPSLMDFLCYL